MTRKLNCGRMTGADGPGGRLWSGAFILLLLFLPPAILASSPAWGAGPHPRPEGEIRPGAGRS